MQKVSILDPMMACDCSNNGRISSSATMQKTSKIVWKLSLWLVCLVLYGLPFVIYQEFGSSSSSVDATLGNVIEQNEFAMVRTHDSGTFVGIKQYIDLEDVGLGVKKSDDGDESENPDPNPSSAGGKLNQRIYYAFRGVPYAKPPLGILRWKEPEVYDIKDAGPKDSTKYQSICSQWDSVKGQPVGSQDCLYLNIFTPRLFFSSKSAPINANYSKYDDDPRETKRHLPVLLYVHDGNFVAGSGNLVMGEIPFMKQDIILVTFNYRLGVFGFLSSGTKVLPGNYGILDQVFVLKWLQKNIHRFGGNSNRITIFGNVLFLQLSPLSTGLFHSSILMQSTTSLAYESSANSGAATLLNLSPTNYFEKFTKSANCSVPKETVSFHNASRRTEYVNLQLEDMLNDCLRHAPVDELVRVQQSFYKFWRYPRVLTPTVDDGLREFGDVLPNHVVVDSISVLGVQDGNSTFTPVQIPMLMGVSGFGEGFDLFFEFYKEASLQNASISADLEGHLKAKLRDCLEYILGTKLVMNPKVFDAIWTYYFGGITFSDEITDVELGKSSLQLVCLQLLQLFGDITVYSPYWKLLQNLRQKEFLKLYNYVFDPLNSQGFLDYVEERISMDSRNFAERHPWDEEFYLFKSPESMTLMNGDGVGANGNRDHGEVEALSDIMVKIWVSFAAYENPKNAVTKHKNWTRWTKFGYNHNRLNQTAYYHIKQDMSQMRDNFKKKEAEFWLETIPSLCEMSNTVQELEDWPTLFWTLISLSCVLFLIIVAIVGYMFWSKYSEK